MSFKEIYDQAARESKPVFSFEFFPPKKDDLLEKTRGVMERISTLNPHFITVTYGAGGGTRDRTRDLTAYVAKELKVPAVAHLTCVGHTLEEIDAVLDSLYESGVKHILALRGDPPQGETTFTPVEGGPTCARDLAAHIANRGDFSIAVAGYPEVHPEAESKEDELAYLREKVEAGSDVIFTQLFFDSSLYFSFIEDARSAGVDIPIVPGIMPVSNLSQLKRFTEMCGASIPEQMIADLEECGDDKEAVKAYGVKQATRLCQELLDGGAPGIHFYTLNKSNQVEQVYKAIS